jgi:1-acyl-sn-glycerol-3-phosphate acyltransferase
MMPAWLKPVKMPWLYRIVLCVAYLYAKIFLRLSIKVSGQFPKGAGLIAANHASFLDPLLVSVSFPEEIHFLARKSLFENRLFGSFIRNLNAHPISGDGKDMAIFRAVSEILDHNQKVLLFPEGKRSFDGQLQPLKQGVALMALKNQVPIIPCWIEGSLKVWPRHKRLPHLFGKVTCIFGPPIYPAVGEDTKECLKIMMKELEEALVKLQPCNIN